MFPRAALLAACALLWLIAAVPTGALYVTTLPPAADVWLDGTYIGHSPVFLDALAAGRHTVSLNRTGWTSQDLDVSVVAGTTTTSSVTLLHSASRTVRGGDGTLSVRGLGTRSLAVDGDPVTPDATGTVVLASGVHELVALTAAGKITRTFTIYPDMRTDIVLRDDSAAPHSAVVAPAYDYLPTQAVKIEGTRVTIRYERHEVDATLGTASYRFDGRSLNYDAAPTLIGTSLYLPLELLRKLTAADSRD